MEQLSSLETEEDDKNIYICLGNASIQFDGKGRGRRFVRKMLFSRGVGWDNWVGKEHEDELL